jgi:hypothetical protein
VLGTFLSRPVSIGIGALLFCAVWLVSRRFREQDREEEAMSIRPQTIKLISISIREPPRAPMTNSPLESGSHDEQNLATSLYIRWTFLASQEVRGGSNWARAFGLFRLC